MGHPANLLAWVALVLLSILCTSGENITVYFVNDLRYDIFSISSDETGTSVCVDDKVQEAEETCFGGLSRLTAIIEENLTPNKNSSLWLNAGNLLGGENFNILKFHAAAQALGFLQFNASALGPELFRYGLEPATDFLSSAEKSLMLASNWKQSSAVKNSSMFSVGEKCIVAVIGFMDKQQADEMKVFGVSVESEKSAIEKEIAVIKADNVDKKILYIALGSSSIEGAKTIAAIPDIDLVIFSGGNFTATETPEEHAFLESVEVDDKTSWVSSVNRNFIKLDSRFLIGQLDLMLSDECKIVSQPDKSLVEYLSTKQSTDLELTEFLRFEAGNVVGMSTVVARSKTSLLPAPNACLLGECSLGGLLADALISKLDSLNETQSWGESVKLAVIPGGIFQNVENVTGSITAQALYNFFVQDEFVCVITLTSQQLVKMLEVGVSSYKDSKTPMPDLLQVSGSMRVEFLKKKVASLWTVSESSESLTLTPVNLNDKNTLYKIAVPSSMLYQLENYAFLREMGHPKHYNITVVDSLRGLVTRLPADNYLSQPVAGGRLVWQTKIPPSGSCETNVGGAVIVTLVVVVAIAASALIVWKIVLPKYRTRRGSTTQLLP